MDLHRLFSTFPDGWPGIGLLLLRAAVGFTAALQGSIYFAGQSESPLGAEIVGATAILVGVALLVGFMTPISGMIAGAGALGAFLSLLPSPSSNCVNGLPPTAYVLVLAAAVVLLGPGALSVDARLFGKRQIIIPRGPRPSAVR